MKGLLNLLEQVEKYRDEQEWNAKNKTLDSIISGDAKEKEEAIIDARILYGQYCACNYICKIVSNFISKES